MTKKRILVMGGLILLYAVVDLFVYNAFQQNAVDGVLFAFLYGLICGQFIGQLNLIAVWAAITEGSWLVRLPWALLLVTMMCASFAVGLSIFEQVIGGNKNDQLVMIGFLLFTGCAIAQIPLWLASRVFRWRLVTSSNATSRFQSFNISQMFMGTTLLALTLAFVQFGFNFNQQVSLSVFKELLDPTSMAFLVAFVVVNLAVVVPCIWAAFTFELTIRNSLIVFGIAAIISIIHFLGLCLVLGGPGSDELGWWSWFFGIEFGQMTAVLLTLRALHHWLGFDLIRLGQEPDEAPELSSPVLSSTVVPASDTEPRS